MLLLNPKFLTIITKTIVKSILYQCDRKGQELSYFEKMAFDGTATYCRAIGSRAVTTCFYAARIRKPNLRLAGRTL